MKTQSSDRRRPVAEPVPLDVLYEDEWLIAVNKPAGMVVHPTYKNTTGTLLNGLLWRVRSRDGAQPGIVTRLDKDTSGLVLAGLTSAIHARVQRDMTAGMVLKEYLALVHGVPEPPRGTIALPLARDTADRRRVVVTDAGAACETRYAVAGPPIVSGVDVPWSVMRCELVTGRTHQIRVHLAARGWPVVGDRVYGTGHETIARQALHAWRVTLPHPMTREPLSIEAPLPPDLRALMPDPPPFRT